MSQYSRDPIINIVHQQIKEPIKLLIEHNHLSSAIKLIYSGIDTMAFLGMPKNKLDVSRTDFIVWVEKYIQFEGKQQLTGLDIYGARCSMLHNHSVYSKLSRQGKCRLIAYGDKMYPPIIFDPQISQELVLVSVIDLAEAFFNGIDKYLVELFSNKRKKEIAEKRLDRLVQAFHHPKVDNE